MIKAKRSAFIEVERLRWALGKRRLIKRFRTAVDGGASCGVWTALLATKFKRVISFEPHPPSFAALTINTGECANVERYNKALWSKSERVTVFPRKPGAAMTGHQVKVDNDGDTAAIAIDDMHLEELDLLKLDLEGAEPVAILGAEETLKRCKPVLIVEISALQTRFGYKPEQTHAIILQRGYREVMRFDVDRIYAPI